MKKTLLSTLFLLPLCFSAHAFNETNLPDKFSIKNCQNISNCSFIMANGNKQAELSPTHHRAGVFYFFDDTHQKQITFKFRGENRNQCSVNYGQMRFDALDQQGNVIAKLIIQEDSNVSLNLSIYEKNGQDLLAIIDRGILGTEQTVYAKDKKHIIAKLTRPLWTLSADSDITIIDKGIFSPAFSPNLLMSSLALYCTHFGDKGKAIQDGDILSSQNKQMLKDKLAAIVAATPGLTMNDSTLSSQDIMEASNLLTQHYQQSFGESYFEDDTPVSQLEKITRLIDLAKDLIFSQTVSVQKEQGILQYLLQELQK